MDEIKRLYKAAQLAGYGGSLHEFKSVARDEPTFFRVWMDRILKGGSNAQ